MPHPVEAARKAPVKVVEKAEDLSDVTVPGAPGPVPQARVGAGVRVASVPRSHVYVEHLARVDPTHDPVVRLADPDPTRPDQPAGAVWWPPAMLEASWVEEHHDEFDLMHVHFGFDACEVSALEDLVAALRRHDKPLVLTVHDLRNPHHVSPGTHEAHLAVLVPAADVLITLTSGAAQEIERRWGRTASVLPHPHVVDLPTMRRVAHRGQRTGFRIGVHVKSLRASMDPLPVLRVLHEEVARLPGAVLQVDGHRDVLEPDGRRYDEALAAVLGGWDDRGEIDLRIHDFFSDAELWDYLRALDVSVLPYRFGTHSGWLEACRDVGTAVLAPDCGYYADQGPVFGYHHDEAGLDASTLRDAVRRAYDASPAVRTTVQDRSDQRDEIAGQHEALYRSVLE